MLRRGGKIYFDAIEGCRGLAVEARSRHQHPVIARGLYPLFAVVFKLSLLWRENEAEEGANHLRLA